MWTTTGKYLATVIASYMSPVDTSESKLKIINTERTFSNGDFIMLIYQQFGYESVRICRACNASEVEVRTGAGCRVCVWRLSAHKKKKIKSNRSDKKKVGKKHIEERAHHARITLTSFCGNDLHFFAIFTISNIHGANAIERRVEKKFAERK